MATQTLELVLPDWSRLDTVRRSPLPFALWTIGDQCLLHHWLDHAVNEGVDTVKVYAADRPAAVRRMLEESLLWPLTTELVSIPNNDAAPPTAVLADRLPGQNPLPPPSDGWELIERAATIEKAWLERLGNSEDFDLISIGFSCRIHPEATLHPPYFIGDHVFIGPGCEIGPYAVIGEGSMVSGANRITHSHLAAHSYLGPVTALENCRLECGVLFNLNHRVRLDDVEPHLLASMEQNAPLVPLRDRLSAMILYMRLGHHAVPDGSFKTFNGLELPGDPSAGIANRRAWLPLVWKGKLPLFGVLPRTEEQLEALDPDWKNLLRHAPVGVFSYADSQGQHSPSDPDEALHAVYQASMPPGALSGSIQQFLQTLK